MDAAVDPHCPYDQDGRRSVVNAVLRTWHLPYSGYERIWRREITFVFHAR